VAAPSLQFWFEFASTYSYVAAMRIGALAAKESVTVEWRPFLLGPIFKAQGWDTSPFNLYPAKGRYMWRDVERQCTELGLPFRRPDPFPQSSLMASRVALLGLGESWGEEFCRAMFRAEFADGRNIGEPAVVVEVLRALDMAPEPTLARAQGDDIKASLRAQTEEAQRLGLFGAPSFVADGELFWGNDRLEQALRCAQLGSSMPARMSS